MIARASPEKAPSSGKMMSSALPTNDAVLSVNPQSSQVRFGEPRRTNDAGDVAA